MKSSWHRLIPYHYSAAANSEDSTRLDSTPLDYCPILAATLLLLPLPHKSSDASYLVLVTRHSVWIDY
jgi:hypothetical protein